MTKEEAVYILRNTAWLGGNEQVQKVEEAIDTVELVEPKWIPVSERMPEPEKDVLVCYKVRGTRYVSIGGLFGDGQFHGYDDEYLSPEGRTRKAIAWMPLPEPWKEKEK